MYFCLLNLQLKICFNDTIFKILVHVPALESVSDILIFFFLR